ncbi:gas vesicle protein GvpN [Desulfosporosinus sp. SYSU MS00001]|uniref:gas vesicle protein GvpN n=1 Tax=Desulfosporosinus sp. SYSU MS00001 TaxID=3416284 RepID=UPI003CF5E477
MTKGFVETSQFSSLKKRALIYLKAGFAVHFCGPAGTGKTSLALHVAESIGRPYLLLHGNEEYKPSNLVGGYLGLRHKKVLDNYIHSVWKTEENVDSIWYDGRLAEACRYGYTLVYDEFTRSRPETNNVLLSVLQESILELSSYQKGESQLNVHPDFALILTSNPAEYAGVHELQDALRDRIITINIPDVETNSEIAIVSASTNLFPNEAEVIVKLVRHLRENGTEASSIRASIMIAKVYAAQRTQSLGNDELFKSVVKDILGQELCLLDQRKDVDDQIHSALVKLETLADS